MQMYRLATVVVAVVVKCIISRVPGKIFQNMFETNTKNINSFSSLDNGTKE